MVFAYSADVLTVFGAVRHSCRSREQGHQPARGNRAEVVPTSEVVHQPTEVGIGSRNLVVRTNLGARSPHPVIRGRDMPKAARKHWVIEPVLDPFPTYVQPPTISYGVKILRSGQ